MLTLMMFFSAESVKQMIHELIQVAAMLIEVRYSALHCCAVAFRTGAAQPQSVGLSSWRSCRRPEQPSEEDKTPHPIPASPAVV